MTSPPPDDSVEAQVERWTTDERASEGARARAGARWLETISIEDSTFHDVMAVAVGDGSTMQIVTTTGRVHVGRVEAVGQDYIALRTGRGVGLVATAVVATVWRPAAPPDVAEYEADPSPGPWPVDAWPTHLDHALGRLTGDEVVVRLVGATGGQELDGEVEAVGQDFLVLQRGAGPQRERVYTRLVAVAEVWPWPFMSG